MGLIQNKVTVSQPNSHVVVKNAGGLRGLTGETGPQGPQGVPGEAATVTAGTTTTLPAGSNATVQNVGSTSAAIFNFGIPKGDKGDTGETGTAATVSVGTTTTLEPGEDATVTNSGTSSAAVFDFGIPKGDKGDTGATGADGYSPSATVTKTGDTATISITDKDGTTTASISDGTTPTVNNGTLTIQKNGTTVQTFSADQASNVTANITVPTQFSDLSGTVSSSQIADEAITTGSVSGTGTNITLAGTMEGGAIESVEMYGDTQQQTYSGKNLFNSFKITSSTGSVTKTVDENGVIYLSNNSYGNGYCPTGITLATFAPNLVAGQSYYIYVDNSFGDGGRNYIYLSGSGTFWNSGSAHTITQAELNGGVVVYGGYQATTSLVVMITVAQDSNYEKYVGGTASPNPDYPQNVNVVTGEQSIEVRGDGKNWFNKDKTPEYRYIDGNGNWATSTYPDVNQEWSVTGNETFTISFSNIVGASAYVRFAEYNADGTFIRRTLVNTTPTTITLNANTRKIIWSVDVSQSYHFDNLQIELGSSATPYEPYKGVTKTVNLGKNLLKLGDASTTVNGITFTPNADGSFDLSGTATANADFNMIIPISDSGIKSGEKYTFSTNNSNVIYFVFNCDESGTWKKTLMSFAGSQTQTVTCPDTIAGYVNMCIRVTSGTTINAANIQTMLEKGSTATTYAPYITPIELCKIGTYQDYIYKSGENWYVHKEIGKYTLDGSLAWYESGSCFKLTNLNTDLGYAPMNAGYVFYPATDSMGLWCNYGIAKSGYKVFQGTEKGVGLGVGGTGGGSADGIYVTGGSLTLANFQAMLNASPLVCDYILKTPTDTQITNATLISELEGLLSATTYSGNTYITVSGDLASPLEVVAESDSKLAPDSVYGAAIKDGAVSVDKIEDGAVTPAKISTSAYQSGETAVGTWIDGKTIYRQVLTGTVQITANNVATVTTTIAAKSIVSTSGWYQSWKQNDTTSNKVAFGHLMGNNIYSYALIRSGNYIELGFISSVNVNSQYEVVVEYTKKD